MPQTRTRTRKQASKHADTGTHTHKKIYFNTRTHTHRRTHTQNEADRGRVGSHAHEQTNRTAQVRAQTTERQKTRVNVGKVIMDTEASFAITYHHDCLNSSICAFTYCCMLGTCFAWCTNPRSPTPPPTGQTWPLSPSLDGPQMCHTSWALTRKRTAWRALLLVAGVWTWLWAQGELGELSLVRLGRGSGVPLSWASWRRYSCLRWRPSCMESRDWSCSRSMEPSRIMESEGEQRTRVREGGVRMAGSVKEQC